MLENQDKFLLTIDEIFMFNSQLRTYLNSSELIAKNPNIYSGLHLICENSTLFSHWINLERQMCQKKIDLIFSCLSKSDTEIEKSIGEIIKNEEENSEKSNQIWSVVYSDISEMKIPNCAELFITMSKSINGLLFT